MRNNKAWTEIEVPENNNEDNSVGSLILELADDKVENNGFNNKEESVVLNNDGNQNQENQKYQNKAARTQVKEDQDFGTEVDAATGQTEVEDERPTRAYKRIKNLLARNQEKDAVIAQQQRIIEELAARSKGFEKESITAQKSQWQRQVESKESELEQAIANNDPKEIAKATKALADSQLRYAAIEAVEEDFDETPPPVPDFTTTDETNDAVEESTPEAARDWVKRNPWFFQDEKKHVLARMISRDLTAENKLDPESNEYWQELDKRLNNYGIQTQQAPAANASRKRSSPVGSSRSNDEDFESPVRSDTQFTRTGNRVQANPTREDVDMSERLGISLNEFMREKYKYAQQGYKGYVKIDIPGQ